MYPYRQYGYGGYQMPNYQQNPNYPPPTTIPQAQTIPQQQVQMPYETPIQDIKFVNRAQAEAYIVYPNTKVMLIDNESEMAYIKTADAMGQCRTDYYRFQPVNADGSPIKPQEVEPQVNFDDFVRRDQLANFGFVTAEQHNALAERLEEIQKQLSANKVASPRATTATGKGGV